MSLENEGEISNIDFQDDIRKKVFWFTRAKLKTGRWPFSAGYMVEDLTRVIPADFYGGSFESAKLSTRANFEQAFNNPSLLAALDARTISSPEREAYALISHGYNSNALLGKIRNAEVKQAVYGIKLHSKAASLDTPFMDAWARISNDEPAVSVNEFINVLRAERNLKHPENFDQRTRPARIDSRLGFGVPVLENGLPLRLSTQDFDSNDEQFNAVMNRISNQIGIELVGRENIEAGKIDIKPKRFFGALDTIKSRLSPYRNGINPTGWPKRFKLEYPSQGVTNTEKLYGVIKCLSGLQMGQLSNIAESVILANPTATNLPSSDTFNKNRGRLSSAAACLVASDVCMMIGLPTKQARLMSETFKLEAQQNLQLVTEDGRQNKNFMAIVANMYAVGINNFAYDLNPSLEEYAENRGISMESVASKMDGSPSLQGLIYANNVITDPALQFEPDMNSEEIAEALDRVFERGRIFNVSLSPEPYGPENRPDLRVTPSEPSVEDTDSKGKAETPPVGEGFDDDSLGDSIRDAMDEVADEKEKEKTPTPEVTPSVVIPALDELTNETPVVAFAPDEEITPEAIEQKRRERKAKEVPGRLPPTGEIRPYDHPVDRPDLRPQAPDTRLRADAQTDANRVVTQLGQQSEEQPAAPQPVDPMYDPETYRDRMKGVFDRMTRVQYNNHPVDRPDLRPQAPDTRLRADAQTDANRVVTQLGQQSEEQPAAPQPVDPMYDPETYRERMKGVFDRMTRVQYNNHPVDRPDLRPEIPETQPKTPMSDEEKRNYINAIFARYLKGREVALDKLEQKEQGNDGNGGAGKGGNNDGHSTANPNINININNNQIYNNQTYITIINNITFNSVRDFYEKEKKQSQQKQPQSQKVLAQPATQQLQKSEPHMISAPAQQEENERKRLVQQTLDRYSRKEAEVSQEKPTVTGATQSPSSSQTDGVVRQPVIILGPKGSTGQAIFFKEEGTKVIKEKKAKVTKPVLKSIEFYEVARGMEMETFTSTKTDAASKCRGVLYELVMEYSADKMAMCTQSAKELKTCKDPEYRAKLAQMQNYNKERASIAAVATVMMYPSVSGKQDPRYNKQSFPEESRAVQEIDKYTSYIMHRVKEFITVNQGNLKGDKITVAKLNKMLETVGEHELAWQSGKITKAQKIERGRELLKDTLRDTVYAILDDVELVDETKEAKDLRENALVQSTIDVVSRSSTVKQTQITDDFVNQDDISSKDDVHTDEQSENKESKTEDGNSKGADGKKSDNEQAQERM